jgi:SagB-type dehydrogenase family enzyme
MNYAKSRSRIMNTRLTIPVAVLGVLAVFLLGISQEKEKGVTMGSTIELPNPSLTGTMSLEEALSLRRSRRELASGSLTTQQVSQILWAAQGITSKKKFRTAPSAGALFPIELYLVVEHVEELEPGLYHYDPIGHSLTQLKSGSLAKKVSKAALGQEPITEAAVIAIITAEVGRTEWKYGDRADRYVAEEVGAVAQNIYLQVESLGLSTVLIGAFYDEKVQKTLDIGETPMGIMPIGHREQK